MTRVVLLSIDPQWATAILDGEKRYEYRRQPPTQAKSPFETVLYATSPQKAIVGQFTCSDIHTADVSNLVDETVEETPHTEADIRGYFHGYSTGSALTTMDPIRYDVPIQLETLRSSGIEFRPPQNFSYLTPEQDGELLELLPTDPG